MKKVIKILSLTAIMIFMADVLCVAGNPYICITKGAVLKYEETDAAGNLTGYKVNTISEVTETEKGTFIKECIVPFDKNENPLSDSAVERNEYLVTEDSVIYDIAGALQYEFDKDRNTLGSEINVNADGLIYPLIPRNCLNL